MTKKTSSSFTICHIFAQEINSRSDDPSTRMILNAQITNFVVTLTTCTELYNDRKKAPFIWKKDDPSARIIPEAFVWFTCKAWKEDDPSVYTDYASINFINMHATDNKLIAKTDFRLSYAVYQLK